jgi:hypothetical protein
MLTVYLDDPQVAAAVAPVELFMEHHVTPLGIIDAPEDLYSRAAPTDVLRRHIDGLVAA